MAIRNLFLMRDNTWVRVRTEGVPLFTMKELVDAAERTLLGKAAGPDRIAEAIVLTTQTILHLIFDVLNRLLASQEFPRVWKEATVTLNPKSAAANALLAFRPI
ncbi:hypothetical protein Trydic_g289 [Trypoxylus dichotomus]